MIHITQSHDPSNAPSRGGVKKPTKAKKRRHHGEKEFARLLESLGKSKAKQKHVDASRNQAALDKAPKKPEPLSKFDPSDAAFAPPPQILAQPVGQSVTVQPPVAGSGTERAQAAAMADSLVRSMRVGKVGKDGHEVRLTIQASKGTGEIEVQIRQHEGKLTAVLVPDANNLGDAQRLVELFKSEAEARGLELDDVSVER